MDKYIFTDLPCALKVDFINESLSQGNSLCDILKYLDIQPSALELQFKEFGYEFDTFSNKYIQTSDKHPFNSNFPAFNEDTLKDMYIKINELYEWYKSQNNLHKHQDLKIDKFEGDATSRSYKVYQDIQTEFKRFCEKHKQYKVQDLVSQAFKEFIDKYE